MLGSKMNIYITVIMMFMYNIVFGLLVMHLMMGVSLQLHKEVLNSKTV